MPGIKEKPKADQSKGRHKNTGPSRQAGRLMKEKFIRELDQRKELDQREDQKAESGSYAVDKVEQSAYWAADEIAHTGLSGRWGHSNISRKKIKENQDQQFPEQQGDQVQNIPDVPESPSQEHLVNPPKKRNAVGTAAGYRNTEWHSGPSDTLKNGVLNSQQVVPIRERPRMAAKERKKTDIRQKQEWWDVLQDSKLPDTVQYTSSQGMKQSQAAPPAAGTQVHTYSGSISHTGYQQGDSFQNKLRTKELPRPRGDMQAYSQTFFPASKSKERVNMRVAGAKNNLHIPHSGKTRPGIKTQEKVVKAGTAGIKGVSRPLTAEKPPRGFINHRRGIRGAAKQPFQAAKQYTQRRLIQQTIIRTQQTARSAAQIGRRFTAAVIHAAASITGSLVVLVGGIVLLIVFVLVVLIAAIASSPFGIFFTEEPSGPDTVSVSQAVASVNVEYNARLESLQAGGYDDIVIHGHSPDWAEVLAVFAARTAGAEDGVDVVTLDQNRVDRLKTVFWDMTTLSSEMETIEHPASGDAEAWTEKILHITITAKTAEEMRTIYGFTDLQNNALTELLSDRAALASLAGSLTITSADVREVLCTLPADLEEARKAAVEAALSLVGKVNYFWGGKSLTIGWDDRWGTLQQVTAAGSSTTGTYRPYGLDCSGMMDWVFYNITDGAYILGRGGGARAQHSYCTPVSQAEAQPGDLAFYPDDSHVGIVVGWREDGKLLVCHCSSGQNNVVVTEFAASGFTDLGRPDIF